MARIISVDTLQDSAGSNEITTANVKTAFNNSAKAWANYHMTANTIGGSLNVSSVTDNANGHFTINFTNSMNDKYYFSASSNAHTSSGSALNYSAGVSKQTVSSADYKRETSGGAGYDAGLYDNGLGIFGDLA